MDIILASQSTYRQKQLESIGLPFRALRPQIDEEDLKAKLRLAPALLAKALAKAKAMSLSDKFPNSLIIGCDQLGQIDGLILEKPGTEEKAIAQLESMSGCWHELITSVCICYGGEIHEHTDITRVKMRKLSRKELAQYVEFDQPLDCAGSYKMESAGMSLIENIESKDPSAVIGIPLIALTSQLLQLGLALPYAILKE